MPAPVDRELGDAFHARADHSGPVAGQLSLDAKAVLAGDAGGDGRNLADREGYRVAGESGRREAACLAGLQIVDVLFGDMEHDAEIAERRDLEQHFALLDRRADALAEIARDEHARQRGDDAGARESTRLNSSHYCASRMP